MVAKSMTGNQFGLTTDEVLAQQSQGQTNMTSEKTSRSAGEIIQANIVTPFNALLTLLFVVIVCFGQLIDGLFFIAVIINSGMGIFQELRAKRTLDELTILNTPLVRVLRDGNEAAVPSEAVVLGDAILLKSGDQIPADGVVLQTTGIEVDESLLTGESDAVKKAVGTTLLSGSIVTSGECIYQATAVGDNAYAHKLTAKVKRFSRMRSELQDGTNRLLGYISIVILIVGPILLWGQITRSGASFSEAAVRSVAAIVGMIPEGLVVLTSFAFVLAAVALARRKVLVQELPAVEGLARVDVICLDKTGTLTDGQIAFDELVLIREKYQKQAEKALATFANNPDSPTLHALHEAFHAVPFAVSSTVAFSSKRKWSAVNTSQGNWIMGAPEILFPSMNTSLRRTVASYADQGKRVLALGRADKPFHADHPLSGASAVALIVLAERIRENAPQTLRYFKEQGVALKIISGDNPSTVAAIARKLEIDAGSLGACDARTLPDDIEQLAQTLETQHVFGRVMPEQKQQFVKALQLRGHVVAMTGDGVNDALALKDADIGIAMGSGAPATRAIARLVLLDNDFAHMPHVLGEGRRVIANIERVANLFVIKNVYTLVFALAVTVLALSFPFLPRHLSIISWLTIGIPAFFLALAPNNQRYVPGFLKRILWFAIPVGVVTAGAALFAYTSTLSEALFTKSASTAAVIAVVTIGLWVLVRLASPLRAWKVGLIGTMALAFVLALTIPTVANMLELRTSLPLALHALLIGAIGAICVEVVWRFDRRRR